ncbi:hypothetical protein LPH44_02015 [Xylella taiwanensis]|uniref:Uncharacterized protein n=1 Tax=Xylella taiwanensis TaxID=1444770 RepID=Z9JGK6_9GAMM|nr:hypothetical protein [Xylella taiwanensis]EWS77324.1 hypothetical protein AF72_11545 [Xylella taiwanensis]MCD8460372.1 hypothetical protein [Xylella taiwanensis]MCD8473167.1 hypothetical protein [Xylella taiwanensis]QKD97811.1 hypothetical protein PLS229_02015 [Xylella taiwanensis]UFN05222.1 hypothetical protein LPH41_04245 [Xylella taiwanensis]
MPSSYLVVVPSVFGVFGAEKQQCFEINDVTRFINCSQAYIGAEDWLEGVRYADALYHQ